MIRYTRSNLLKVKLRFYTSLGRNLAKVIVDAPKEFMTQFLSNSSQKLNFFQRWFGFEGTLNQIVSNPNYLLMFHAFASIPDQSMMELSVIQKAVNSLLDEYLETSWFISTERKKWATDLKDQMNTTKDMMGRNSLFNSDPEDRNSGNQIINPSSSKKNKPI